MKTITAVFICLVLMESQSIAQREKPLMTQKEKVSYSIGLDIGKNFKQQSVDIDPELVANGIKDALSGAKPMMTEKEIEETMMGFQKALMAKQSEKAKVIGEKNKIEGEKFLAENKKKEGVVTLPSGLQYKILKEGTGPKPQSTDTVECHYRGTLINGKEFDSSYKRGQRATFPLYQVIKGWTEALQLMPVGSKWQLFIPSNLCYGEQQRSEDISPNSTLIFEVELVSIKK